MSNYSGWMPSQIKIELRRRGARASGQKADLVQKSCSPEGRMIVNATAVA